MKGLERVREGIDELSETWRLKVAPPFGLEDQLEGTEARMREGATAEMEPSGKEATATEMVLEHERQLKVGLGEVLEQVRCLRTQLFGSEPESGEDEQADKELAGGWFEELAVVVDKNLELMRMTSLVVKDLNRRL